MAKNSFKVFDSDIHTVEPDLWVEYIEPRYKDRAPRVRKLDPSSASGGEHFEVDGRIIPVFPPGERAQNVATALRELVIENMKPGPQRGFDRTALLEAMGNEGIDIAAVFPTLALRIASDYLDPGYFLAICKAYNDWLYDFCKPQRDRLLPVAFLTAHNIEGSIEEARRCVKEKGFVGAWVRPHRVSRRNWYERRFDPLWAEMQDLNVPMIFHAAGLPWEVEDHAARRFYGENLWLQNIFVHTQETAYAMATFIGGGILDRFPKLRVAFLEGNCSWMPHLLWRMDEYYEIMGIHEFPELKKKPSEYYKEGRMFLSVESDEYLAKQVVDEFGDQGLLFSTDYPHADSKYPKAVESFLNLPFSEATKRRILWDNPVRFYGLEKLMKKGNGLAASKVRA